MSSGYTVEHRGRTRFAVPIHRSVLRDARLDFAARGLFSFLWDLPENWVIKIEHLVKMGPNGRDAIRAMMSRLKEVGAIDYEVQRDKKTGRLNGQKLILIDPEEWAKESPLKTENSEITEEMEITESRISRRSDIPASGKSNTKVLQEEKVLQCEAAAQTQNLNAAASFPKNTGKHKQLSIVHGMECWTDEDKDAAAKLASSIPQAELSLAISKAKKPLPGLVLKKHQELTEIKATKETRALQADAWRSAGKNIDIDPERISKLAQAAAALKVKISA